MRRRTYLAAGGNLAATLMGGGEAIERGSANRGRETPERAADLEVRILETNMPVEGGALLEVTVEIENAGTTSARPTIESVVDGDRRASRSTTVDAGDVEVFDLGGYRTYPVEADEELTVRVETEDDADERTVDVLAVDGLDPAQATPDPEITVQPGTAVLFEVESDALGEYGGRTQWFVDGEYAGWSMGPWYSAYYGHRGADYWQETFESPGTHEVTTAVGEDETVRASWTVEVSEAGTGVPSVDDHRPADESLEVVRGEPTALELDVSHPGGALERVVWWLGHADTVLETTDVSGTEDTAAIDLEGGCHGCPIVVWVIGDGGTVLSEDPWVIEAVEDEPDAGLEVTIDETNDPVDAGDVLEVTATVENATDAERSGDVELIVGHDPEQVDSRSVTVDGGDSETVDLEFTTATVSRTQTFPARVEVEDDADERSVEVVGTDDVALGVTIDETNAPVQAGEFLDVVADLENTHGSALNREVQLVVGHDLTVVDTASVRIEPGETETVELSFETATVETDQEFPVRVESDVASDERTVLVRGVADEAFEIEFVDCTQVAVTGAFEDGDDVTVKTLFVDSAGVGNAHSGVTIGDEIDAPFSGTVSFQIAEEDGVADRTDDEVLVELATAGFGSTIGSVIVNWFEPDERRESNPLDCVDERRPDRPTIALDDVDPVDADSYEVAFGYESSNDLELAGGAFVEGTTADEPPAIGPGANSFSVEWTPETDDERLVWVVDLEQYLYDESIRAETEPAGEYPTVEPATFAVTSLDATDPVSVGDTLEATADIENVGDEDGEAVVQLDTDLQQGVDTQSVSLPPDESESVALVFRTTQEDVGERTVTASTDDDGASVQVTVTDPEPDEPDDEPPADAEPDEPSEEPGDEPSEDTPEEAPNDTPEEAPNDTPEVGPDETSPDDTPEEVPDEDPPADSVEDGQDEPSDGEPDDGSESDTEPQPDDQASPGSVETSPSE